MNITVVVNFYEEAELVPHFVNHYAPFADRIFAYVSPSKDGTQDLLLERGVEVQMVQFPNGFDDALKLGLLNNRIQERTRSTDDWFIVLDSDELIWPQNFLDYPATRQGLEWALQKVPQEFDAVKANMWQIARHESEFDLDPTRPPMFQRRHGDPNRESGGREMYRKPIIVRANRGVTIGMGQHTLDSGRIAPEEYSWDGGHWRIADPSFVVKRHIRGRRDRLSDENKRTGRGTFVLGWTPEGILAECENHKRDPQLF